MTLPQAGTGERLPSVVGAAPEACDEFFQASSALCADPRKRLGGVVRNRKVGIAEEAGQSVDGLARSDPAKGLGGHRPKLGRLRHEKTGNQSGDGTGCSDAPQSASRGDANFQCAVVQRLEEVRYRRQCVEQPEQIDGEHPGALVRAPQGRLETFDGGLADGEESSLGDSPGNSPLLCRRYEGGDGAFVSEFPERPRGDDSDLAVAVLEEQSLEFGQ